jgi:predicted nucleic acid-binding protein
LSHWYLDSSIALHVILPGGDARARTWLEGVLASDEQIYSSVLLHLELTRVLRREQLDVALADLVLDRVEAISINDGVLQSAAMIETDVKSLDAIHLASCMLLGPDVTVVTHDAAMSQAAQSLGFGTTDPVASAAGPRHPATRGELPWQ